MSLKRAAYSGRVVVASKNPGLPPDQRPYHRPDCSYAENAKSVSNYWVSYSNIESAIRAGHRRACQRCLA